MLPKIRQSIYIILISVFFAIVSFYLLLSLNGASVIHQKSYDALFKIEYKLRSPPKAINNILLVVIDNDTLQDMPQRWPYSRSSFATVIKNLKKAQARAIAFDFIFWGKTDPQEDDALTQAVREGKVVLPCLISDNGMVEFSNIPGLTSAFYSGVVTKIQDKDGIIRRNLTYIVNKNDPLKGILSLEMQILRYVKSIDLSTLVSKENSVSFQNNAGEQWTIPVENSTKTFPIHFHAHAVDFNRLSFYHVFKGDFDPGQVKDKIIILGTLSSLFGDIHNTPIGWLPGIALNANAFLNLYTHDFLKNTTPTIELYVIVIAVIISSLLVSLFKTKTAILLISLEICLILSMTYVLLTHDYIWHYFLIASLTILCPLAANKVYLMVLSTQKKEITRLLN